jgi:hypothetical protein
VQALMPAAMKTEGAAKTPTLPPARKTARSMNPVKRPAGHARAVRAANWDGMDKTVTQPGFDSNKWMMRAASLPVHL